MNEQTIVPMTSLPIDKLGLSSAPEITVILTTYNRERLVRQAIESLLAQTVPNLELLIIDDGSQDSTYSAVRDIVLADPRIRYHFATNRGLSVARNLGIQMALAPWITFLDSDDTYAEDHLALRLAYLAEHPTVDLLHGGVEIIGPSTVPDRNDPAKQIDLRDCTIGGTFVIRRTLALALSGFGPINYGDDNDFFLRAQAFGAVIAKVEYPTYRYNRLEPDSLCAIVFAEEQSIKRS